MNARFPHMYWEPVYGIILKDFCYHQQGHITKPKPKTKKISASSDELVLVPYFYRQQIKEQRNNRLNMNQEELCHLINITVNDLKNIESGSGKVPLYCIKRLSKFLGIHIEYTNS